MRINGITHQRMLQHGTHNLVLYMHCECMRCGDVLLQKENMSAIWKNIMRQCWVDYVGIIIIIIICFYSNRKDAWQNISGCDVDMLWNLRHISSTGPFGCTWIATFLLRLVFCKWMSTKRYYITISHVSSAGIDTYTQTHLEQSSLTSHCIRTRHRGQVPAPAKI